MRRFMKYRKPEEQEAVGVAVKRTALLPVLILGMSLVMAGCGNEGGKAGDTGAENAVESESSDTAGKTESADDGGSVGTEAEGGESAGADSQETADASDASAKEMSVQEIYKSVEESVQLPSMVEGDDDFISNYYGIDPANLDSYVFASAEDATLATSVIIMKAKSEDAVGTLESSLNTVKDQKAAEMQGYIPEQYDIVADSSVKTEGLYVYLVIAEDAGDIESVISAAIK